MNGNITYKGKKIWFRDKGSGPAIVLLHGFLENMGMWDYHARKLSDGYRVVTVDLPGFGRSECIDKVHLMEQMATAVNRVLKELQIKKCLMIGHSMGGYVTLAFASKFPRKLKGFGLLHSHALADTPEGKLNRNRAINVVTSDHGGYIMNFFPELFAPDNVPRFASEIDELYKEAVKTSPKAIIAALEGMKYRTDKLEVLVKSSVPVLFILGKKDNRVPFEKTMVQATLPSSSEIIVLDNVGHMGHIEARKQTLNAIRGFAEKVL